MLATTAGLWTTATEQLSRRRTQLLSDVFLLQLLIVDVKVFYECTVTYMLSK